SARRSSLRDFKSSREQAGQHSESDQALVVVVHVVPEAGVAFNVRSDHSFQVDRGSVWINNPCPDHLKALLSVRDSGTVDANDPRPLRNEQVLASSRVIYIGPDQSLDFAGEIRIDRLLQDGWDVPTRLHLIFSKRSSPRRLQIVFRCPSVRLFEECFLFVLLVLLLIVHTMGRGPRRYQSISDILQTRCALAASRP